MQLSWAATAVVWSAFRLRPEYWHSLTTDMLDRTHPDFTVLDWDRGDKGLPARPFETRDERQRRVTAADHPVLRRALTVWLDLLHSWQCDIICPVVQPLRRPDARPRGALVFIYKSRSWCVWPSIRRSCRWFGTVLRATADRLHWPEPSQRKPHSLRGGANLEGRLRGVARIVRHAQCWWSLRFMGARLAYEPPTLEEMASATRDHWATTQFLVVRGVPVPVRPPAGTSAAARDPTAPPPADPESSSSSSDSEPPLPPVSRAAAAANRRRAAEVLVAEAAAAAAPRRPWDDDGLDNDDSW